MDKKALLRKVFDIHVWSIAIIIIGVAAAIAQVTITTYYPSPYGGYNQIVCSTVGPTGNQSLGTIESPYYFGNPSGYGTTTPPRYWININGSAYTGNTPSPTYPNEASRLQYLLVSQLFDSDYLPSTSFPPLPVHYPPTSWYPILDMSAQTRLYDLNVARNVLIGVAVDSAGTTLLGAGNCTIGNDLVVKGNIIVNGEIRTPKIVGTSTDHFGGQGVMLYNNLKVFNDLRVDRNIGAGNDVYKHECKAHVDTRDGTRSLVAIESPEVRFFDEGKARLQDGIIKIKIDEIFKQGIETDNYNVYLTLQDDCKGIWVSERTPDYFVVRELQNGNSNAKFTWMISGVRKGCQGVRFEPYETTAD